MITLRDYEELCGFNAIVAQLLPMLIQKRRVISCTYLWICPFLCRYSSPSNTSRSMVAMVGSSSTPFLCSPFATICLIISRTEPENGKHNSLKDVSSFHIIQNHFEIKTHLNLFLKLIV